VASQLSPSPAQVLDYLKLEKDRRQQEEPEPIFELSDMGNAQRLAATHGWQIRFAKGLGWLIWDGKRWATDDVNEILALAMSTVRNILDEAKAELDRKKEKAILDHHLKSQSGHSIREMVFLCRAELGIPASASDFDRDPLLFNVENGTIDLRTRELKSHNRLDFITKIAPVYYDPDAQCPLGNSSWRRSRMGISDCSNSCRKLSAIH